MQKVISFRDCFAFQAHLLTKFKDRQGIRAETQIATMKETSYLMEL